MCTGANLVPRSSPLPTQFLYAQAGEGEDLGTLDALPVGYQFVLPFSRSALRNWLFQVSKDGHNWLTIQTHENDTSLGEPG